MKRRCAGASPARASDSVWTSSSMTDLVVRARCIDLAALTGALTSSRGASVPAAHGLERVSGRTVLTPYDRKHEVDRLPAFSCRTIACSRRNVLPVSGHSAPKAAIARETHRLEDRRRRMGTFARRARCEPNVGGEGPSCEGSEGRACEGSEGAAAEGSEGRAREGSEGPQVGR